MSKYAHVVAFVNPFSKATREIKAIKGTKLGDALRKIGILDSYRVIASVAGKAIDRSYLLGADQLVLVRVVPKAGASRPDPGAAQKGTWGAPSYGYGGSTGGTARAGNDPGAAQKGTWGDAVGNLLPWVGGASNIVSSIGGLFFGNRKSNSQNVLDSQFVIEPDPQINYNQDPDSTGGANTLVGSVAGISNQEAPWNNLLCVLGKDVRVFPVKGTKSYSVLAGNSIYSYGCLDLGYGELALSGFKIGSRDISEFTGLTYELQYGKADDVPFTIPLSDIVDTPVSIPMTSGQAKTVRAGAAATKISFEFELPRGLWHTNIFFPTVKQVHTVSFGIYYKLKDDVSYTAAGSLVLTDLIETYKRLYFEIPITVEGVYDVQVVADGTGTFPYGVYNSGEASANWIGLKAYGKEGYPFNKIIDSNGDEVYCSRIAVQSLATAEQQGATESFSCLASHLVPHWNGTTWDAPAASDNPADLILYCMKSQANFNPVPDSDIDLDSFVDFYDYCVANNCTYNKVVDQGAKLKDLIDEIAACGRASVVDVNGRYTVIIHRPQEAIVQHFSLRTIIRDSFTSQLSLGESPNVTHAQYLSPGSDWQQDEIEVYDDGYTAATALTPQTILFPGVTSSAEAHKRARYLMACTKLQFWTYTFRAETSHLICRIGDRIKVTHDAIFAGLGQGRISQLVTDGGGNITAIKLDAQQYIESGKTYGLRILHDGEELHLELNQAIGWAQTLTLATPIPFDDAVLPVVGNQVQFGELGFESIDCLITAINPAEDFTAQITCIDYNEDVFVADDQPIPDYVPRISQVRDSSVNVPLPVLQYIESGSSALVSTGRGVASSILLTLAPVAYPVVSFEAQYKPTYSTNWSDSIISDASTPQVRIGNVVDGRGYDIRVQCRSKDNYGSGWVTVATNHVVIGKTEPPPDIPGTVHRLPFSNIISWFYDAEHGVTVPLDFAGTRVKMAWGENNNWDQGVTLSHIQRANQFDIGGLAKGRKTIMLKAVDDTGNEQAGAPAYIALDFGDVVVDNLLYTIPIDSSWDGISVTGGTWSGATVEADDDGSLWFGDDASDFFSEPLSADWFDQTYAETVVEFSYTPPLTELKPFRIMLAGTFGGAYKIEYRLYGQSPWFTDPLSGDWFDGDLSGDWFDDPAAQWLPMPDDGLQGAWQRYDFRITLFGGSAQGTAGDLNMLIDVPDIVEYINDFIVDDTAGKRLTLSNTYRNIDVVNITLEQNASYPNAKSARRLDKSISGPMVRVYDLADAGATGIVDVIIKGY